MRVSLELREDLKIQLTRLAVFVKPQFTLVNEYFTKNSVTQRIGFLELPYNRNQEESQGVIFLF